VLTNANISDITSRVRYERPGQPEWRITLGFGEDRPYIQVRGFTGADAWTGRKWYLSRHMTVSEVVTTCFKAIITAEEHETREFFTYRLHPIFSPHFDVEALVELHQNMRVDVRENAMQGAA
jgi:hypothetical protein